MKARLARRPSDLDAGICWNLRSLRVEGSGSMKLSRGIVGGHEIRTHTCSITSGQPRHERREDGICTCEAGARQETASGANCPALLYRSLQQYSAPSPQVRPLNERPKPPKSSLGRRRFPPPRNWPWMGENHASLCSDS